MIGYKALALVNVVGVTLVLAPLSSASADQRFHDGHRGRGAPAHVGYAGHGGYGYGYGVWPVFGLAAAVVGTAAAIVTAPFAILAAVASGPYYGPAPGYAAPSVTYNDAPPAYYGTPAAPAYYNAPAAPAYYVPPARSYSRAAAPVYSGPPARAYYRQPPPGDYDPRQAYYTPRAIQYGPPPDYYRQYSPAPRHYYEDGR